MYQGFQEQQVKFQDQIFSKFQDIFVDFTRLKTQKMHVFLCSQILISRYQADQYCNHKNVTKANVTHITMNCHNRKQYRYWTLNVSNIESSY